MNNTGYCRVDHEAGKTGFIETVIIENLVFYYDRLLVLIVVLFYFSITPEPQ
ncbi:MULTISPECIES: hypothetical protein [Vibrio]|uniref:Uncharacterized protein n=1 Tax=Vibrio kanaloae TaxID=170673 RepID=A0ABV4LIM4_9VIBR|nr:hypothetical protein [Vibrio kanaloae]